MPALARTSLKAPDMPGAQRAASRRYTDSERAPEVSLQYKSQQQALLHHTQKTSELGPKSQA